MSKPKPIDRLLGILVLSFAGSLSIYSFYRLISIFLNRRKIQKGTNKGTDDIHRSRYLQQTKTVHIGCCHCQRICFRISAPKSLNAVDLPSKIRFPRVTVPIECFELLSDESMMSTYATKTETSLGIHIFCSYCGVHVLFSPSLEPTDIQINADCLDRNTIDHISYAYHTSEESTPCNVPYHILPENEIQFQSLNHSGSGVFLRPDMSLLFGGGGGEGGVGEGERDTKENPNLPEYFYSLPTFRKRKFPIPGINNVVKLNDYYPTYTTFVSASTSSSSDKMGKMNENHLQLHNHIGDYASTNETESSLSQIPEYDREGVRGREMRERESEVDYSCLFSIDSGEVHNPLPIPLSPTPSTADDYESSFPLSPPNHLHSNTSSMSDTKFLPHSSSSSSPSPSPDPHASSILAFEMLEFEQPISFSLSHFPIPTEKNEGEEEREEVEGEERKNEHSDVQNSEFVSSVDGLGWGEVGGMGKEGVCSVDSLRIHEQLRKHLGRYTAEYHP